MKKTENKNQKIRSYARTIASNFWVPWQPPIEIVTPYFGGLVPYESAERSKTQLVGLGEFKLAGDQHEMNALQVHVVRVGDESDDIVVGLRAFRR